MSDRPLSHGQRIMLLGETALMLTAASLAIRLLPFTRVMAMADLPPPGRHAGAATAALWRHRVRWAILVCARRLPWHPMCFPQGLAAHWMLHRRGLATTLYYGARPDAARGVEAHVWVRDGGEPVIGVEAAAGMAVLAQRPSAKIQPN